MNKRRRRIQKRRRIERREQLDGIRLANERVTVTVCLCAPPPTTTGTRAEKVDAMRTASSAAVDAAVPIVESLREHDAAMVVIVSGGFLSPRLTITTYRWLARVIARRVGAVEPVGSTSTPTLCAP